MASTPKFCKCLFELNRNFGLPQAFMEKYNEILPEEVELRISGGATWKVWVEKLEEGGGYLFTRGWAKFCRDMGLQISDTLVFSYSGNSAFDVSVFLSTGLEKELDIGASATKGGEQTDSGATGNPRFPFVLKPSNYSKMRLPTDFVKAHGLSGGMKLWLEYYPGGGKYEEARLVLAKERPPRVMVNGGWVSFCKTNNLTPGKT
ncbi:putative B3 domain-containing protein REM15 [Salvia miltiorrhiza]|uniref:putative B3 domain-containing protein REM15 n=1 Tax=Salvia miltiorrhiza TaxID=226208 RepID=UPI0025AB8364|nr:putative B3 domain-containing protein REM15 [Salvia miltiorrhiza]